MELSFFTEIFLLSYDELVLRLLMGAVIGLCLGTTGVGGGVLIIPILQLVFGMSPVLAVGTASVISAVVKVNAAFSHVIARNVSWHEVGYILAGAIPFTLFVTHFIVLLTSNPRYAAAVNVIVQILILSIMVFSLLAMIRKYQMESRSQASNVSTQANLKVKGVGLGAACGTVMASTGVGGGVLILPTLNIALGVDIKRSVGSSIVIAFVLSGLSALNYSSGGQSDISTAFVLVAGALFGIVLAMKLVKTISNAMMYQISITIITVSILLTVLGMYLT